MVKKSAHPNIQLFEYLNGALDEAAAQTIEAHLFVCNECASVAKLVGTLKTSAPAGVAESQIANHKSQNSMAHPGIDQLAAFFYSRTRRAGSSTVAAHIALCGSCSEAIAQYARAERVAAEYRPAKDSAVEAPARAWEMIRDWEDSSFAKPRPATEVLGQELLTRLARALTDRTRDSSELSRERSRSRDIDRPESAERIPVHIVNRSGEIRSVELFEQIVETTGARVLRHAEGSDRFDNRLVHALLNLGEKDSLLISELIQSDTVRLEPATREGEPLRRVDYFIVEDSND